MTTKTKKKAVVDAKSAFEAVRLAVESIRNDEYASVPAMEPGDTVRQGDLYIVSIDVTLPGKPYGSRQLAPGTTLGSRHVVEGDCEVLAVEESEALAVLNRLVPATKNFSGHFIGPVIEAKGEGVTITHPEHGDRGLQPGTYLVVGQRAWAETLRRQQD